MNQRRKSELMIIISAALWGMIGVSVTSLTDMGFTRLDVIFLRSLAASAALGIYLFLTDRQSFKFHLRDIWCFIGAGIVSLMLFNICYFTAMKETSLAVAAVLLYTAPAFVVIMSAFLFKEKITGIKMVSLIFMFIGCIFVTGMFEEKKSFCLSGILWGLGAGFGYALYSVFSRYAINRGYSSQTISIYTFIFSAIGSAFFVNFKGAAPMMNLKSLGYTMFIGIVCCTIPYILYTKGLEHTENGKASVLAMIEPLVAALISVFWYNDSLSASKIMGMVIMFAAIGIMSLNIQKIKK